MSSLRDKALSLLPHGPEFRFLDRIMELDPGRSGRGEYSVRGTELFLAGHFPQEPIFPGVLLIEAAAQLAGTVAQTDPAVPPLKGLKLTALRGARITGTARPGERIELSVTITGRLGNLIQARTQAKVGDQVVLQAELTLSGET